MSIIEMLIAGFFAVVTIAATAFGVGHSKGKGKAEKEATERETKAKIEQASAAARRQTQTSKEASDVQETVTRMPGSDVDDELRKDWLNK